MDAVSREEGTESGWMRVEVMGGNFRGIFAPAQPTIGRSDIGVVQRGACLLGDGLHEGEGGGKNPIRFRCWVEDELVRGFGGGEEGMCRGDGGRHHVRGAINDVAERDEEG